MTLKHFRSVSSPALHGRDREFGLEANGPWEVTSVLASPPIAGRPSSCLPAVLVGGDFEKAERGRSTLRFFSCVVSVAVSSC